MGERSFLGAGAQARQAIVDVAAGGRGRAVEHAADLGVRKVDDIAQHQRRALLRRQVAEQCGDAVELERLLRNRRC
jgi:hypothetical protein